MVSDLMLISILSMLLEALGMSCAEVADPLHLMCVFKKLNLF